MSIEMTVFEDGVTADIRVTTRKVSVVVEVRERQVRLKSGKTVTRYCVQPPGAEEPWSRHIDPEAALIAGLRRARKIEREWR